MKIKAIMAMLKSGCAVFPVVARGKKPAIKDWQRRATKNRRIALRYFRRPNEMNYGVLLGGDSNVFVVEYDGLDGKESLTALTKANGFVRTLTVESHRGEHSYLRAPAGFRVRNSVGRIAKGIDIRGEGGFVVGAGSTHPTGSIYRFKHGRGPDDVPIADAPLWLLRMLAKLTPPRGEKRIQAKIAPINSIRATACAQKALEQEIDRLRHAPKHQRNNTLNLCSFKLGQLIAHDLLDTAHVKSALTEVADEIGLDSDEIPRTIKSGLQAGIKCPRNLQFLNGAKPERDLPRRIPHPSDLTSQLAKLGNTDTDNANRFASRFGHKVLYTPAHGWMAYDGKRWCPDALLQCIELAKKTARRIADEVACLEGHNEQRNRARFAEQSLSKAAIDRMLDLAKSLLVVEPSKFDANPWLLNTLSGTIDLKTGLLNEHDPRDLLTKTAPVEADMGGKCPIFDAFLDRIFAGDSSLIAFVQRAAGYTLTGDTSEQVFFYLRGKGSNGKTTLLNQLRGMLGGYGLHTPNETLLVKQFDNNIPADIARLAGARMVTANESNFNRQLDEAKIKAMTGGDPITARFMRQNFFEFKPEFKLWFAANDLPRVRATSDAFWRRALVIPFEVHIPKSEVDPELPAKLWAESPGILAWVVRGCLEWQRIGLSPPKAIVRATNLWRAGVDVVKRFITDCVIFEHGKFVTRSGMYASFKKWCDEHGEQPMSIQKFKDRMQELDIALSRLPGKGTRIWKGVSLRR
jgi:putative DNA primase/helicase